MNKFNARKTQMHGKSFDSLAERNRYMVLLDMQRCGEIEELRTHPRFELIKAYGDERAAHYTADFMYRKDGQIVVEDVKSPPTRKKPDYVLRRKLFKQRYPEYTFVEVL